MYIRAMSDANVLRIGELSRRSGVSPELLRAWERRYGLLDPTRSKGGLRLYSPDDLERVRDMQRYLESGMAAAEAATLALREKPGQADSPRIDPSLARVDLAEALAAFDGARADAILDDLLAAATIDTVLSEVLLPFLEDLGRRWERGEASVAEEHFASSVLRGRMLGLARGWGRGLGPVALLACLPGEQHDFGAMAFGLALRARGWRIAYLGADTPLETVEQAAVRLEPDLVVLSGVSDKRVQAISAQLAALARRWRVAVGGKAALADHLSDLDLLRLPGDPVEEAERVSSTVHAATV
jgi:MerR family transcriptional regulator, light-induced transcriptional regulator